MLRREAQNGVMAVTLAGRWWDCPLRAGRETDANAEDRGTRPRRVKRAEMGRSELHHYKGEKAKRGRAEARPYKCGAI